MCKHCPDCKQMGKMKDQGLSIGRKKYHCNNPVIKEKKDSLGFPRNNFIGFGEATIESPLAIKTSPRWCPRKIKLTDAVAIVQDIVDMHNKLIRVRGDKWVVEDSDLGLEVKTILLEYNLIERETIND